jgi:hypothetical protein
MRDRKCPDCGEFLSVDALRCICGWGSKKPREGQKSWDHQCTYKSMGDRCSYPVGMFAEGATSGWCVFHRQPGKPGDGAEIVRQSREVPYTEAVAVIMARHVGVQSVVEKAWDIALHHGSKPWQGEIGQYAKSILERKRNAA